MQKGDHVVLINDDWYSCYKTDFNLPVKGKVYTIRAIMENLISGWDKSKLILLEEITNPPFDFSQGTFEPPFRASRFRPLQKLTLETLTSKRNPLDDPKRKDSAVGGLRQRVTGRS